MQMEYKLPITLLPQTDLKVINVNVTMVIILYSQPDKQVDIVTPVIISVIQVKDVKLLPNNVEPLTNILTSM